MSNGLITRLMRPAIATLLYRSWTTTAWKLRARDSRVCMQYRGAEISAGVIEQRAACEYYRPDSLPGTREGKKSRQCERDASLSMR